MATDTRSAPAAVSAELNRLLSPRSVAIVGASEKPGALGASVLANLERNGFSGDIHLINPKRAEIGGRPCLPSIDALPVGVDAAVLAIPRAGVMDAIRALAARGCGAAVVFSAGFAEGGEQGLADQREIGRIAAEAGMVIEGPNCLGLVNHAARIPLTFVETLLPAPGAGAGVGIVSQSGAMAAVLGTMLMGRTMHLTLSVSTGNEAASGVEDYVEHLIADPATQVIALIVEQFRQPQRFLAAARAARVAGKRIVLLHPGKSSAARESAATHTGAMAGDYALMRAMVERAGVVFAETLEELGDIAEIASRCPALPAGGTAVLGESGAFKALTLDLCEELSVPLPALDDGNAPLVRAAMPDFVAVSNPLDITAQGLVEPDIYYRLIKALHEDDRFGCIVAGIIQTDDKTTAIKLPPILRAVSELTLTKPLIYAGLDEGASISAADSDALRAAGVPVFPSSERVFRAIARLNALTARDVAERPEHARAIDLSGAHGVVPEYRAKQLLAPVGIPFPQGGMARSADEAVAVADRIGYPVAIKAQSAALSHKSDAGGVILNLANADAVRAAWDSLYANVAAYDAGIVLDGALIEGMGKRGLELIIGAKRDADWGPVVLVGFGGVTAEILKDVRLITPDMTQAAIIAELGRLKSAALLHGYRGSPALDVAAVAQMVVALMDVLIGTPAIREVDLNPVIVHPQGEGVVALDALMLVDPHG
ncbi:acetate--CoA ligase family protein [Sphingomonas sp. BGYR3]|uniref:acetate--CoA ligase family protein n=1 Tax=Sphingomonas sp. BGYR3 TaxID=2975483 RepID=UPI0021A45AD3|nr:acetate--CoA ligase family protein [Sphingomonas sp. BGYR3]MDG5489685.1 acetate--CoA ligase family protein [Sphingomonas sp. BGYR3]